VSTVRFRSFKDLKINARSVAVVFFAVGSSAVVSLQTKPAFVLVWLLAFYVALGLAESLMALPKRRREEEAAAIASERRRSHPPT
jgi:CDP-diacylglycerol--serine O-phosphatidyltransferase